MLSEKPWKVEWVLLLGATLMMSLSLGILLSVALGHLLQPQSPADPGFHQFVVSTLSFHCVALILTHQFLKLHGVTWIDFLGLRDPRLRHAILAAIIAGVLMVPAALLLNKGCGWLLELVSVQPTEQRTIKILRVSVGWRDQLAFGLGTIVLAPLVEEILFRGILYPFLKQRTRTWLAALTTSLVFAAIHTNLVTFIPLMFIGLCLVGVYEATDRLLAPILTHSLFNAVNFAYLLLQMKRAA